MKAVPPAQTLLWKNRSVRVWEMVVEPGASYPLHGHRYPYLSLVLEGASLVLTKPNGEKERLNLRAGEVLWRARPGGHSVHNIGQTRFRNRLIEILR